jgi:drug/metabolite transporter (DMT)-like permease
MSDARHPILLLLLASIGWSLGGLLIKSVDWNPMAIAASRSAVAAVTILILAPRPRFTFSRVQVSAAMCYSGTVVLFVMANTQPAWIGG